MKMKVRGNKRNDENIETKEDVFIFWINFINNIEVTIYVFTMLFIVNFFLVLRSIVGPNGFNYKYIIQNPLQYYCNDF